MLVKQAVYCFFYLLLRMQIQLLHCIHQADTGAIACSSTATRRPTTSARPIPRASTSWPRRSSSTTISVTTTTSGTSFTREDIESFGMTHSTNALSEGVRHFRSVVMNAGSRGTTHSYAKTILSRMKLTMCEPASMTTDKGSRRVTSYFYSA